jgi:hypothetical protein
MIDTNKVSPPLVIEDHAAYEDRIAWLLSFGGSNPAPDMCIELTKDQCWWLHDIIMKIDPSFLQRAKN